MLRLLQVSEKIFLAKRATNASIWWANNQTERSMEPDELWQCRTQLTIVTTVTTDENNREGEAGGWHVSRFQKASTSPKRSLYYKTVAVYVVLCTQFTWLTYPVHLHATKVVCTGPAPKYVASSTAARYKAHTEWH